MNIVAIIPARAGSKRLPGKNKKMFLGKPLICWTIDLALEIDNFDEIIVSTDDDDIIEMCLKKYTDLDKKFTVLRRSKELASDSTPMWKVIASAYRQGYFDKETIIVLLQPTSVLRLRKDINTPIAMFMYNEVGVVSIYKTDEKTYKRNGSIYIDYCIDWIVNETVDGQYYLMPEDRSVDIDTIEDFELAEKIMKEIIKTKIGCKHCDYKGWYWVQPIKNLNLLPSGNFGRLGNEIKASCLWCKPNGLNSYFKEEKQND